MPRVSIVMPVYNGEKYLRESIDSILAQAFTDWEFIIVNEFGSNEESTAILQEYAQNDPRIAVVQNKERLGIAASMNIGLDMAQGEYIARMDADDISMPERLKKQVEFMDSHPEIDICGIKPKLFGESCWDWKVESDPEILKSCILFFTPFVHPTVMIRTARLNQFKLRYDAQYRYTEDYDFFARASENLTFTNIQDVSLYHYRMHSKNATTVGGNQGIMLYRGVTKRLLEMCGLTLTEHEVDILCIHTYPRSENVEQALDDMSKLDLLLKRIFFSDIARVKYGRYPLFHALHIRWMRVKEDMQYVRPVISDRRFEAAFSRGLFYHSEFYRADGIPAVQKPKVSIVLPAYNSKKYIADTVYSLLEQTYQNFELLIVNEFGSDDQTVNILQLFQDPRIKVIQNKIRLGLADSLNEGIRQAAGEYIARADADDLYPGNRLEKQVAFLDSHPDISVCGSWQCHFGKRDYIHQPPETPEQMKAQLLFTCDVCHSTVMFRKFDFVNNDFWYDASYLSEDFELWCRASQKLEFATLQEVLGEYRWDGENITASKMDRLDAEAQRIIARTLKNQLEINIAQEDMILLSGWFNPFQDNNRDDRKQLIDKELKLLNLIENQNRKVHVYDEDALHDTLERRKRWVQGTNLKGMMQQAIARHMTLGEIMKKVFKKVLMPFYRPVKHRVSDRFDQLRDQLWNMDGHICDVKEDVRQHDLALKNALQRIDCLEDRITEQTVLIQKYNQTAAFRELRDQISKSKQDILQTTDERIWKAEQNVLQTLDGRIWEAEKTITYNLSLTDYSKDLERISSLDKNEAKIFIFGTPFHSNMGDQAQAYCISEWCKKNYPDHNIFELRSASDDRYNFYPVLFAIKEKLSPNDKIFVHSGSHITDLFNNEQILTLAVLQVFYDWPVILFPQSIFFKDIKKLDAVADIYNSKSNLLFMARDYASYEIAKIKFNRINVMPYPDIVHVLIGSYQKQNEFSRQGVLLCKRDDVESLYPEEEIDYLISALKAKYLPIDITDTTINKSCDEIESNRKYYIDKIVEKFSKYKVVITDRMHGTIFSLAANTPVIILNAEEHKVISNSKWYEGIEVFKDYVYCCKDLEEVKKAVDHIMSLHLNYKLPPYFEEEYYDNLKEVIENHNRG